MIIPPADISLPHLTTGPHYFFLSGYEMNDEKPVVVDGNNLSRNGDKPTVILLDFLKRPSMSPSFIEGKTLTLKQ